MYVAIDEEGYYYDPETGADLEVTFNDYGQPLDANSGLVLQFWGDSGFDGSQITQAVRDVLIGIYGNPGAVRANAPRDRFPVDSVPQSTGGVIVTSTPRRTSGEGGAGIQLSTTTLMLIAGGVLLFMLGQSRGGNRR